MKVRELRGRLLTITGDTLEKEVYFVSNDVGIKVECGTLYKNKFVLMPAIDEEAEYKKRCIEQDKRSFPEAKESFIGPTGTQVARKIREIIAPLNEGDSSLRQRSGEGYQAYYLGLLANFSQTAEQIVQVLDTLNGFIEGILLSTDK